MTNREWAKEILAGYQPIGLGWCTEKDYKDVECLIRKFRGEVVDECITELKSIFRDFIVIDKTDLFEELEELKKNNGKVKTRAKT